MSDSDPSTFAGDTTQLHDVPSPDAPSTNPPSTKPPSQSALEVVALCALVAAAGALLSESAPTGTRLWDPLLTGAFAAAFVVAAARANTTVVVAVAGLAAALVGLTPWLAIGLLGFAAAIGADLRRDKRTELQALGGALAVTALLHLRSFGFFGLPSLIAGAAAIVVFVSGYRRSTTTTKRRTRLGVGLLGLALLIVFGIAGVVGLSVRGTANDGIAAARNGLSSARAGDPQALTTQLELAAEKLADANDAIDSPLLKPIYLVPVAAQHLRAVSVASGQGSLVAGEAAATVVEADLGELQLRQGQFDLDLLTTMAPRLTSVASQLSTSVTSINQTRSGWLLGPIDDRIGSLVAEVRDVQPEAQIAAEAAQVMPGMLGADGERRYLMLFGAPSESRDFGGFVGGFALLSVVDGRLNLVAAGSTNDLEFLAEIGELQDPRSYPTEFVQAEPALYPQNITNTPNIGVIARAAAELFPSIQGRPIDGVIYADPYALAAFSELTGPVWVEGLEEPLFGQGIADFIFEDQYRLFERFEREDRFRTIGALASATAAAFERADLPGPERLGQVLGPVARAGRLQIITQDDRENAFLASVLLQRSFVAPTSIDAFAVIQNNGTESKLDLYVHRRVHYDVTVNQDGSLAAVVDVSLESIVPDDAPALTFGNTDGTNKVLLSLYSPHELKSLTVDGQPHEFVVQEEFGFFKYALFNIALPVNSRADVRFELEGTAPAAPYRVGVWSQPLVNLDTVQITYRTDQTDEISRSRELVENWVFDPTDPDN